MPTTHAYTNRLIDSNSPYLLQHAHNPVDWYPWGEEAFERAQAEDKPIFLSIGYSTCHWCHVMAHESFEDSAVARLLNEHFICIKVDREERPDIDQLYMTAATSLIGRGGWPLTIVMGADRRPFFAGTYFPKESSPGRVGLLELLPRIQTAWVEQRKEIEEAADQIIDALKRQSPDSPGAALDTSILTIAAVEFKGQYDAHNAGFGRAPKFPSPHNLTFLLRQGHHSGDPELTEMALQTLRKMRLGGLFDQVGFGFHRYSTDARWHLPHFEKMLYDQASLMLAYTEAWEIEKDPLFRETVAEIFSYLQTKLRAPHGSYYSAEDADSDGEEGKFYVWTYAELQSILGADALKHLAARFQISENGNFMDEASGAMSKSNIFHFQDLESYRHSQDDPVWAAARTKLYVQRESRIKPGLDDKILTDWNALLLSALSRAARIFGNQDYLQAARDLADGLLSEMIDAEDQLIHVRSGKAESVPGFVDDYSFLIQGLRNLYEAAFEIRYLEQALRLQTAQLQKFWDSEQGGLFFTPAGQDELFLRQKEIYDGAIPSGNSVATENLYYLGRLTENEDWEAKSFQISQTFSTQVKRAPRGFSALLVGIQPRLLGSRELVIAGNSDQSAAALELISQRYDPFRLLLQNPVKGGEEIQTLAPFLKYQKAVDNQLTVYICENYTCQIPIIGLDALRSSIIEASGD